jgi:hypothetical protein
MAMRACLLPTVVLGAIQDRPRKPARAGCTQ